MAAEIREWAPERWVFGHTHYSVDVLIGRTRVVAAHRGYVGIEDGADTFRPAVVEV